jgi:Crp-like helix-turn-helix domain
MNTDNIFLMQVCLMLSDEVYRNTHDAAMIGCMPAKVRLEEFLCELVLQQEADLYKSITLELPLKQFELAQITRVRHEYLSTLLKKLKEEGLLLRQRSQLAITDPQRLIARSSLIMRTLVLNMGRRTPSEELSILPLFSRSSLNS